MADSIGKLAANLVSASPASPTSRPSSPPAVRSTDTKPALFNRGTDAYLPRLFTGPIVAGEPREIARALTERERAALEARATELRTGLHAYADQEEAAVNSVIAGMLSGWPQLSRLADTEARARVAVLRHVLAEFPLWAIRRGCQAIPRGEVECDPPLDARFPPSDAQVYSAVHSIVREYRKTLGLVEALLAAKVKGRDPEHQGPLQPHGLTAGEPHNRPASIDPSLPDKPRVQPGYATRVAADLASRARIPLPGEGADSNIPQHPRGQP